ncbi:hypothetical protein H1C71_040517 [Ictidomys tridecemlineatus]|nr:hypothetical protein H1C71_040517 [Ictidomys tridecemlineatus]
MRMCRSPFALQLEMTFLNTALRLVTSRLLAGGKCRETVTPGPGGKGDEQRGVLLAWNMPMGTLLITLETGKERTLPANLEVLLLLFTAEKERKIIKGTKLW